MKKLSDYKDEEAIELWADLLDPFATILADAEIANAIRARKPALLIAKDIIKKHKKEAEEILLRVDPTPINGLNIIIRLMSVVMELINDPTMQSFFEFAVAEKKEEKSSGSATENTEGGEQ